MPLRLCDPPQTDAPADLARVSTPRMELGPGEDGMCLLTFRSRPSGTVRDVRLFMLQVAAPPSGLSSAGCGIAALSNEGAAQEEEESLSVEDCVSIRASW